MEISYTYPVGGHLYTGSRYRYDKSSSSDSAWAEAVVRAHPPGMKVPVFYDPSHPESSLLATGIIGSDLFHLAFMTPFNAVMLVLWWLGFSRLRRKWLKPVAGGVKIINEPGKMRVRLPAFPPFIVMLATTGLLAFLSLFVVGFAAGGMHPTMRTMILTWAVILCGGLLAGGWHFLKILSCKYDLIIDKLGGSVELPLTHGRKIRRRVPVALVQEVRVETVIMPSKDEGVNSPMLAPTLLINGSTPHSEQLAQWYDAEQAAVFVQWLRNQLPSKPGSPAASPVPRR